MNRKNGYINLDEILKEIGIKDTRLGGIFKAASSPFINIIKYNATSLVFSFLYKGEWYYFKSNFYTEKEQVDPYNELVAEELAHDAGIPCVEYDLAILGDRKGVVSKDYKKENVRYIDADLFFQKKLDYYEENTDMKKTRDWTNNLEDIWNGFEMSFPHQRENIAYLMRRIIDIYLFDIMTGNIDRHEQNWQMMESEDMVDIAPIFDNERILATPFDKTWIFLRCDNTECGLVEQSIQNFLNSSSDEFKERIYNKLWIISEENLYSVFERIERKTGTPMPNEKKVAYRNGFAEYRNALESVLKIGKKI